MSSNQPTHRAYAVRKNGEKSHWTQIGACWPHKDGRGWSIQLEGLPLDGKLVIRPVDDSAADAANDN